AYAFGEVLLGRIPLPTERNRAALYAWLRAVVPPVLRYLGVVALGFAPFLLWELFSLLYYGFPFPNTAYAKLHTGIAERTLLKQGVFYLLETVRFDPLLAASICVGFALPFLTRSPRHIALVCGGLLYVAYTVYVGGDFMAGRFFTAPFFI